MTQPLKGEERALVRLAYQRLEAWRQGCQEIHDRARESRRIYRLMDPKQDPPGTPPAQRTLQLQTLKATVNNCVADQMDNMPQAVMIPERPGLEQTAEDLTDVVRFILDQNDYEALHRRRVEDFFIAGTAVTQVAWDGDMDRGRGNVALIRWPIEAFLWDPAAEKLQDARAVMKAAWYPMSWFQAHYPQAAPYISPEADNGLGRPEAQADRADDEPRAMLLEYWWRTYDAKTRRYHIHMACLAGGALLWVARDVYRHGLYPFVLDVFTPIEGLPVGDGLVQELADMMRYVNRYAHYVDENLRMAAKNRALVRRNANLDLGALCDWQRNIIEGDDIGPDAVQWFQSKPLSAMAPQQMLQFQGDIKQDSGQNQFTRGETAGGVTAASAISALQEAGGKITRLRTQVLSQGFKGLVEQIIWLVSQFYEADRTRLITGRSGQPRQVDMGGERLMGALPLAPGSQMGSEGLPLRELKKGRSPGSECPPYQVQIQVTRRNPLRVQAQNELYLQAYEMAAKAGQPMPLGMLFELMQVDGKDRILPALREADALAQTARENQQLKQQLASLKAVAAAQGQSLAGGPSREAIAPEMPAQRMGGETNG